MWAKRNPTMIRPVTAMTAFLPMVVDQTLLTVRPLTPPERHGRKGHGRAERDGDRMPLSDPKSVTSRGQRHIHSHLDSD